MRDYALFAFFFGVVVPYSLREPYIAVLAWSWVSYMNPQRLTWGPAYGFPFAKIVAIILFISMLLHPEKHKFPMSKMVVVWLMFYAWTLVTCHFAIYPSDAWSFELEVFKIQLILFIAMWIMDTPKRITAMVWMIFFSIGFFGIKGGVFTILTGGGGRVYGPAGSFISDNNQLAVALLMVIPLGFYLRAYEVKRKLYKNLLLVCIALIATSVIGSFSRGALLAITASGLYLWWKSSNKLVTGMLGGLVMALVILIMPRAWEARMMTIDHYHKNQSAEGRINSWHYAINIANARLTGGGYRSYSKETFARWAPDPNTVFVAHSIYFSALADNGWIGLILFVTVFFMGWRKAGRVIREVRARGSPDDQWIAGLTEMIKVSLIAYAVGGAFLSLTYFDLPWHLLALIVLLEKLAQERDIMPARRQAVPPRGHAWDGH